MDVEGPTPALRAGPLEREEDEVEVARRVAQLGEERRRLSPVVLGVEDGLHHVDAEGHLAGAETLGLGPGLRGEPCGERPRAPAAARERVAKSLARLQIRGGLPPLGDLAQLAALALESDEIVELNPGDVAGRAEATA